MSDTIKCKEVEYKANVLIEALPYIQKFKGKIVVIKYGGSAMVDSELKENVMKNVALLKSVGMLPVIVHGGGNEISKWSKYKGLESEFYKGLRVTDAETMEIAEMVLGSVNKGLVGYMESMGVKAVGLSGKDGFTIEVTKKYVDGKDIGFVGDIIKINTDLIYTLLNNGYIPVICPIGMDKDYETYNINADEAAGAIAVALEAEKLAFLTDTEGFYLDFDDKSSLISRISVDEAEKLIEEGKIEGGMLPKIQNCVSAVKGGVKRVHILDGRKLHSILLEIFTNKGIGTLIYRSEEIL
ncbi:acetylglutamate kinase [Anaerosphaera multitolerans]|uniref:Acetylglutamate kinase n=1 Tax=Anaerosphaera multitolerans TaxID=2487351 RepID=A0A437S623_9FIRM|nr:acetylglutamate kinase [Anaerosphaera multitolerans]RVU54475.1 acetylglutamate kinase [Anaerosphaera multitolerans]